MINDYFDLKIPSLTPIFWSLDRYFESLAKKDSSSIEDILTCPGWAFHRLLVHLKFISLNLIKFFFIVSEL